MDCFTPEGCPSKNLTTLDKTTGCKWPIGKGHPFLFCNDALADPVKGAYCSYHEGISRVPVKKKSGKTVGHSW